MQRFALFCCFVGVALADTIANCTYDDARGNWTFLESPRNADSSVDCASWDGSNGSPLKLWLEYPNVAFDELGNRGTWTLIYNQGFEVIINYRKIFVYFSYTKNSYDCSKTMPGWSHDVTVRNWACIQGTKSKRMLPVEVKQSLESNFYSSRMFKNDEELISQINLQQNSWVAGSYPEFENLTHAKIMRMRGGIKSKIYNRPSPASSSFDIKRKAEELPKSFDWRNVDGQNFVSPVRNQGQCGSCYGFSAMGMLEARVRIASKNRLQPVFSPQDIVSCTKYAQGCEGGFPYLIAGKYAQDFGVVSEECNRYRGADTNTCGTNKNCTRTYSADYHYVGDYYGACNKDRMKIALVKNGPMSVSFEAYPDFQQYRGGVYHHTGLSSRFNPFEITNHAVLLVGYGETDKAEKYWIVKNSWGSSWGEAGYFRIRRGTDECAIESLAVESFPII